MKQNRKIEMVELLKTGRKSRSELAAELKCSYRTLRKLRHEINTDGNKPFEEIFIVTYEDGGYGLFESVEDLEREYAIVRKKVSSYFHVLAKISWLMKTRKEQHLF